MNTVELKALVGFVLSVVELVAQVTKGISFSLVGKVVEVARAAGPALSGAKQAFAQYVNMTDAEAADLEAYVVKEFDVADDKVEEVIESALKVAIQLHGLVKVLLPKAA